MIFLPMAERELRAEARQRLTYCLRVVGAAATVSVFTVTMLDQRGKSLSQGLRAFSLFLAVLPMMTLPFLLGAWTGKAPRASPASRQKAQTRFSG